MIASRLFLPSRCFGALALTAALALLPVPSDAQAWGGERITGSGVVRTETRSVAGFHGIVLGVSARVELRQGDGESLSITGDDNIVPLVETVVADGVLKIRWKGNADVAPSPQPLAIVVDAKRVDALTVGGTGRIHAVHLKSPSLRATIGGAGDIALDALDADALSVAIGGSGRLTAAGRADVLEVTVAGSGELAAAKLESRRATIVLQGSAQADVWAKETLGATIAGSGEITYRGKPRVNRTVVGSGTIRHAGDAS
jgi:hypothetical protein